MHTLNQDSAEFQYVKGQMREGFRALFDEFEQRNSRALTSPDWALDVPYGEHPREVFDLHPAGPQGAGTVVYFHAGYWQARDKAQFRFLAPAFNALGWDLALVNYPLCPEVDVARIVACASRALGEVTRHQAARGCNGPVVLCGHSAGAHLAVELALQHVVAPEASALPVAGVVAISGVFDLQPLVATSLNERLKLDTAQARACSVLHRAAPGAAPALFIVGETETRAFHEQTQRMAAAWREQDNLAQWVAVQGADHFSVLMTLCEPGGLVDQTLRAWRRR